MSQAPKFSNEIRNLKSMKNPAFAMFIRALSTDDHPRSRKVGGCGPVAESLRLVREKNGSF